MQAFSGRFNRRIARGMCEEAQSTSDGRLDGAWHLSVNGKIASGTNKIL